MNWAVGIGILIALIMTARYMKSAPKRDEEGHVAENAEKTLRSPIVQDRLGKWRREQYKR